MTVQVITAQSPLSLFSNADTIFEITGDLIIPESVQMGKNTVLRFMGGKFSGGIIIGNQTSVEALGNQNVFDDVELTGTWVGAVNDLLFEYAAGVGNSFNTIFKSLLRFEKIDLFRPKYYFSWSLIENDTPQDIDLDGHGAVFFITGTKVSSQSKSVNSYNPTNLFSFESSPRSSFLVKNLIIEDNAATSGEVGYGEPNVSSVHTYYNIFAGLAICTTEFDNVKYDGGGQFCKLYNHYVSADRLIFRNCDLHCNGFAVEIYCDDRTGDLGPGHIGHLNEALFDNCVLHNHYNEYVGVLSFVGVGHTKLLQIVNSKICGYLGNLEVTGVERLLIDNTIFVNHGLCSEVNMEGGSILPGTVRCTNSQFFLTTDIQRPDGMSFECSGETFHLSQNILYLTKPLLFHDIGRFFLNENQFVVPASNEVVLATTEQFSARIGYYRGNRVSCPRVANHHISLRLDTTHVAAQYEPFKVAFYNDIEVDTYHYGYDWSVGFKQMNELNGNGINLVIDSDGYAGWTLDTPELTTNVINETVTVSLIGKAVATTGSEMDLVFCEINEMLPFWIQSSPQSVFRINLYGNIIADIPRAVFSPESQDVRIDVTITQRNGFLDFFVFVNRELYTRHRRQPVADFSPTRLTFSPNDQTKVRLIRFVPGGFILDEPPSFINWQ